MTDTPTDDRPAISAGIITQDGAVLLVQRKVKEGVLSWQFPAGEVEPGETLEEAAARETVEETGLTVSPVRLLGERIHPNTGRRMAYVACDIISGTAHVADADDLADLAWVKPADFSTFVPYGFAPVVQDYLESALAQSY
jgi:8-oxo-dGTP diphosphatase